MKARNIIVLFSVIALASAPASATELLFENINLPHENNHINADYGDNVTGVSTGGYTNSFGIGNGWTPNIDMSYSASSGSWNSWYDDWEDPDDANYLVDKNDAGPWDYWYTFTPDAGWGVQVNSFDLDDWGVNSHQIDWTIFQDSVGGTVLDSGSTGNFGGNLTVTTAGSSYMGTVVLQLRHTGLRTYLATDNLNFDQVVPEPSSFALTVLGLLGLPFVAWRRRR